MGTITKRTQTGLLVAALIGGALAAAATRSAPKPSSTRRVPEVVANPMPADSRDEPAPSQQASIRGTVREVIQVPHYTYVRLDASNGSAAWAAVNFAPGVKVGDSIQIAQAQLMQNFHSASLNRDFESIYFGVLSAPSNPIVEPAAGGTQGPQAVASIESNGSESANPHAQVPADVGEIKVGTVTKAKGDSGYTIAEIYAKKSALLNKPVRVHAVVVKSTPDVLGKTFVHVRDGSARGGQQLDLTVTTQERPQLRDVLVFEGKLQLDVDLGAGYKYPLILQDARIIND